MEKLDKTSSSANPRIRSGWRHLVKVFAGTAFITGRIMLL